ncbi:hypothetical protein LTR16_004726 [Cryomyces antarcticus]|uniref:Uncharacterized protein n=1 Tax=Cryomyces antarcticus TaxID=329879 RepID=A0ABR0M675_9PEZI|nr:hypothetical protein LTR60_004198 [Cryomyces antarcticus]KAK5285174.1 hypothetical protein LTR16_004726 [Cryomyces antarcticus]
MAVSCPRPTWAHDIISCVVGGDCTHEEVDDTLVPPLAVKHWMKQHPIHMLPVPGTTDCPFCNQPQDSWEIVNPDKLYAARLAHAKSGSRNSRDARLQLDVEAARNSAFDEYPARPWTGGRPVGPCPVKKLSASEWAGLIAVTAEPNAGLGSGAVERGETRTAYVSSRTKPEQIETSVSPIGAYSPATAPPETEQTLYACDKKMNSVETKVSLKGTEHRVSEGDMCDQLGEDEEHRSRMCLEGYPVKLASKPKWKPN